MSAAGTPFASSRWTSMDSSVVVPACRAPVTTTTYGLSIQPTSVSSSRRGSHECSYGRPVRHGLRMLKISMFIADTSSTWCKHTVVRPNDKDPRHLDRPNDELSRHLVGCSPTGAVGGSVGVGRYGSAGKEVLTGKEGLDSHMRRKHPLRTPLALKRNTRGE